MANPEEPEGPTHLQRSTSVPLAFHARRCPLARFGAVPRWETLQNSVVGLVNGAYLTGPTMPEYVLLLGYFSTT